MFNTPAGIICAQQFGVPTGRPVFYFHGQISSRREALYWDAAASQCGIRLIALDRQGFGNSPPSALAGLQHWPAAVVSIADQLGLGRFSCLGVSAGAKFALAVVLAVPGRLANAAIVSGFGELDEAGSLNDVAFRARFAVALYRRAPILGDAISACMGFLLRNSVETLLRLGRHIAPPTERLILADPAVLAIAADVMRTAANQGALGMAQEFRFLVAPWNLALHRIRVPVEIWHGIEDVVAPIAMAEALAAKIPGSNLHRVPEAGHVSLLVNHAGKILASL